MNLEALKSEWQQHHREQLPAIKISEIALDTIVRSQRLAALVRRRDWLEALGALTVVMFFGVFLWTVPCTSTVQIGAWIIMLGSVEIVVMMAWARRRDERLEHDQSLPNFCRSEVHRLDRQICLLRNVTWWYSGPMVLGCCVMFVGFFPLFSDLPSWQYYGFLAAFFVCFVATAWIVQRGGSHSIRNELLPLQNELKMLLESIAPDTPAGPLENEFS
jgi:hypothetical protein